MYCSSPSRRGLWTLRKVCARAAVAILCLFIPLRASAQDPSQDVAEAARQEKARRAAQSASQSHVYTNEDLRQSQILTDAERTAAAVRKSAPAVSPQAPSVIPPVAPADATASAEASSAESLGEVARRYRREKAAREAVQARKVLTPSPFHLEVAQPALAELLPRRTPPVPVVSVPACRAKSTGENLPVKRDPFSRPKSTAAIAPAVRNESPTMTTAQANSLPVAATHDVVASSAGARKTPLPAPVVPKTAVPGMIQPGVIDSRSVAPVDNARALPPRPGNSQLAATEALRVSNGSVTIRPGDSLWNLSRKYFGSGIRWRDWLISNPDVGDPRRIQPGMQLVIPQGEMRSRPAPPATLVVQPGDSLWKLAAAHFGQGASWPCLANANPALRGPALIYPGQRLAVPAACAAPVHHLGNRSLIN